MVQLVFNMYIDDDVDVLAIQSAEIGVLIFCGTDKKNFSNQTLKYTYLCAFHFITIMHNAV